MGEKEFWAKVEKTPTCWIWRGARKRKGYGNIKAGGRFWNTHRYSWVLAFGPIPFGMNVLHSCDNPPCVRPDHLRLGTLSDNMKEAASKGRLRTQRWARERPDDLRENMRRISWSRFR